MLFLLLLAVLPAQAQPPVIDMHLHALAADSQGPPPLAMCTPIEPFRAWDPAGPRVMFGSDQMVWPGVIERSIAVIDEAPFLDAVAKRHVLYNNAARFLRLGKDEIARHHQK